MIETDTKDVETGGTRIPSRGPAIGKDHSPLRHHFVPEQWGNKLLIIELYYTVVLHKFSAPKTFSKKIQLLLASLFRHLSIYAVQHLNAMYFPLVFPQAPWYHEYNQIRCRMLSRNIIISKLRPHRSLSHYTLFLDLPCSTLHRAPREPLSLWLHNDSEHLKGFEDAC